MLTYLYSKLQFKSNKREMILWKSGFVQIGFQESHSKFQLFLLETNKLGVHVKEHNT